MLSFIHSRLPDDWISAWRVFAQMRSIASRTRHAKTKHVVGVGLPFLIGAIGGFPFRDSISVDFIQGYLTVLGVLAGFVVTLMLFTGSGEGTDVLNHHSAERYAEKILYLLFSQTVTLICYLVAIALGACWLFSNKAPAAAHHPAYHAIAPFVLGAGVLALVRTMLLPAQIYERHEFVMSALIDRKREEHNKAVRAAKESLMADRAE